MAWNAPTVANVTTLALASQEQGIVTNSLPSGVTLTAFIQAAIDDVVPNMRSMLALPGRAMGPDGTLPDEASIHFISLVRRYIFAALTGTQASALYTDDRRFAAQRADGWLSTFSKVNGGIVPPTTDAQDQPQGADSQAYTLPGSPCYDPWAGGAIL